MKDLSKKLNTQMTAPGKMGKGMKTGGGMAGDGFKGKGSSGNKMYCPKLSRV